MIHGFCWMHLEGRFTICRRCHSKHGGIQGISRQCTGIFWDGSFYTESGSHPRQATLPPTSNQTPRLRCTAFRHQNRSPMWQTWSEESQQHTSLQNREKAFHTMPWEGIDLHIVIRVAPKESETCCLSEHLPIRLLPRPGPHIQALWHQKPRTSRRVCHSDFHATWKRWLAGTEICHWCLTGRWNA